MQIQLVQAFICFQTATAHKCLVILLSPLWQMPPWHQVAHAMHCYPEWHNFPVCTLTKTTPHIENQSSETRAIFYTFLVKISAMSKHSLSNIMERENLDDSELFSLSTHNEVLMTYQIKDSCQLCMAQDRCSWKKKSCSRLFLSRMILVVMMIIVLV